METGVINNSQSTFSLPIVMVKKKDGTWKMYIDYKRLNKYTVKDTLLIPVIEELLDELNGAKVFSKLHLSLGYHQIRMNEANIHKTACRTHEGYYEYAVFKHFLRKCVLVFFDDILIYNKSKEEHWKHLQLVLKTVQLNTLFAKQSKCYFAVKKVEYLGHIITAEGVSTYPTKIQKIKDSYAQDSTLQVVIQQLENDTYDGNKYAWEGIVLIRKGKIVVGADEQLRTTIVQHFHVDNVTTYKISTLFYWKGLRTGVKFFIKECDACQRQKSDLAVSPGPLQPLPVLGKVWSDIYMYFIMRLHKSQGKYVIFVVVDRLSKYEHFMALNHPTLQVMWLKYFWIQFTSFMSMAKHPSLHSSYVAGESVVKTADWSLQAREATIDMIKFHNKRAQDRIKKYADMKRRYEQLLISWSCPVQVKSTQYSMFLYLSCLEEILSRWAFYLAWRRWIAIIEHVAIMDRRIGKLNNKATVYVLVKWANHPEDATGNFVKILCKCSLTFL
ncbi:retrotransposable element Tf2 [Tanacetum coccineum]